MIKTLLTSVLLLITFFMQAQDQKWSVEVNYPIDLAKDNNEIDFTLDAAIKYRFINLDIVQLGLDFSGGLATYSLGAEDEPFNSKTYYFQPKLFAEFNLPFISNLHPSLGLGYSFLTYDLPDSYRGLAFDNNSDGGFNLDLGVYYDITKRFFIQAKYDYIALQSKGNTTINGEPYPFDFTTNIDRLKVGIGFRF